jgi:hypothetical protein
VPHGKASLVAIGIERNNKQVNKEVSVSGNELSMETAFDRG